MIDRDSGLRMAVLRPSDPTMAQVKIEMGRFATKHNQKNNDFFQSILSETGDHIFVGYLSSDGHKLLDKDGFEIGPLKSGDSFVTIDEEKLKKSTS